MALPLLRNVAWLLLLPPTLALSAPLPKQTEQERIHQRFGTLVDPDKDCQIELVDGQILRIRVPGRAHSFHLTPEKPNAPRVLRTVAGDFVLQVRVALSYDQDATTDLSDWPGLVGAGLLILDGTTSRVEIRHLHERLFNNPWRISAEYDLRGPDVDRGGSTPRPLDSKPVYLRMTRRGNRITADWSPDGRGWLPMHPNPLDLPLSRQVQVGFHVIQNTKKPIVAEFDQYQIRKLSD